MNGVSRQKTNQSNGKLKKHLFQSSNFYIRHTLFAKIIMNVSIMDHSKK
jgi:hypothetical protein